MRYALRDLLVLLQAAGHSVRSGEWKENAGDHEKDRV
jgi:hypothetical protein